MTMNANDGPEYRPLSPGRLDIAAFIKELVVTRQKYRIKVTAKLTSDIEARRIAILALTFLGNILPRIKVN